MSSSRQFAIMSLHGGQKYCHEVCAKYLSHSAISSIVSGKGSFCGQSRISDEVGRSDCMYYLWLNDQGLLTNTSVIFIHGQSFPAGTYPCDVMT